MEPTVNTILNYVPHLTNSLVSVYIEVLTVLFIVIIGPEIIQAVMSVELRSLMNRFPSIFFQVTPRSVYSMIIWFFFVITIMTFIIPHSKATQLARNEYPFWKNILAPSLVILTFLGIVLFRRMFLGRSLKKIILDRLTIRCIKSLETQTIPNDNFLKPIIFLGENNQGGNEKYDIITELNKIASKQLDKENYDGTYLENVIVALEKVLLNTSFPGDDQNFSDAGQLLVELQDDICESNRQLINSNDVKLIKTVLERLAFKAVENHARWVVLEFIDKVSDNRRALFRIGAEALKCERNSIGIAALNKLETTAEDQYCLPMDPEKCKSGNGAYLLGLIAHYWDSGEAGRTFARRLLLRNKTNHIIECLDSSFNYHTINTGFFITADKIHKMKLTFENAKARKNNN